MWKEATQTKQNTHKDSGEYHENPEVQNVIRSTDGHEIVLIQNKSVKLSYNKYGLLQLPNSQNTSISDVWLTVHRISVWIRKTN